MTHTKIEQLVPGGLNQGRTWSIPVIAVQKSNSSAHPYIYFNQSNFDYTLLDSLRSNKKALDYTEVYRTTVEGRLSKPNF